MRVEMRRLMMVLFAFLVTWTPSSVFADGKYPVRISEQSIVVYPVDRNTVEVMHIIVYRNGGKNPENVLPIYLPEGYENLTVRGVTGEQNKKMTEKGFNDLSGLEAGKEKRIVLSYQMPMRERLASWKVEQAYVSEKINVIIEPGIMSLEANDLLTQSDLFEMNGKEFRRFIRMDLHPDTPWPVTFRLIADEAANGDTSSSGNIDEQSGGSENEGFTSDGYKIIGGEGIGYLKASITVIIIITAFTASIVGLKRDLQKTTGQRENLQYKWLMNEKERLLKEIKVLTEDCKKGLIGEESYELEMKGYRERLLELNKEIKKRVVVS